MLNCGVTKSQASKPNPEQESVFYLGGIIMTSSKSASTTNWFGTDTPEIIN
jgi:hypothetical protein